MAVELSSTDTLGGSGYGIATHGELELADVSPPDVVDDAPMLLPVAAPSSVLEADTVDEAPPVKPSSVDDEDAADNAEAVASNWSCAFWTANACVVRSFTWLTITGNVELVMSAVLEVTSRKVVDVAAVDDASVTINEAAVAPVTALA